MGKVTIAGAEAFIGSQEELLDEIDRLVSQGANHLVVTPNVDQVLNLRTDPDFHRAFAEASLRILDGMPLVLLARLLGARQVHRHTGADLLEVVAATAVQRRWRVAITGGENGVAAAAADALRTRTPAATIRAFDFPKISSSDDPASGLVISALADFQPSVVFLCLGSPKQEKWFEHWRHALPDGVYVGAGAAVDFSAGIQQRSPNWMQQLGMEWLWRLLREPRRLFGRYLIKGPRFIEIALASLRERVT